MHDKVYYPCLQHLIIDHLPGLRMTRDAVDNGPVTLLHIQYVDYQSLIAIIWTSRPCRENGDHFWIYLTLHGLDVEIIAIKDW